MVNQAKREREKKKGVQIWKGWNIIIRQTDSKAGDKVCEEVPV